SSWLLGLGHEGGVVMGPVRLCKGSCFLFPAQSRSPSPARLCKGSCFLFPGHNSLWLPGPSSEQGCGKAALSCLQVPALPAGPGPQCSKCFRCTWEQLASSTPL
uniref:Uncharacterized protein n=1 Tax=Ficedula albicollis TaxID=59894 RepID=A0A803V243_FICAL